ncbi:SusC/RagA family TonB-linked outer membrane protein [Winogradskyella sp.]|uniref:SusC/RagA family TonB-linked outer membrane protein n=1 Tax=Winogradskyella sp. TaxID=1883156 RepID=UPI0025F7C604|nr:SusC/RagA family TonB-linked outer membrane protein [Winogradskyella sp.]
MKLKLTWLLTLFMAFVMQFSFAQEKTVTGTVTTIEDGLPLPGVNVIVKGTSRGVQTDFDGNYSIKANVGDVLVFSYVGMKTTELPVGASNTIDLAFENDNTLDEVVIVASSIFDVGKEVDNGVSSLGEEQLKTIVNTTSIDRALQGNLSGVNVVSANSAPGATANVNVRGSFSPTGGLLNPLYVVDGTYMNSDDVVSINSNNVASVQVLTDASQTALYGSRGSNGVVIITTKKGKKGKSRITLNTRHGWSERFPIRVDLMNSRQKLDYENALSSIVDPVTGNPLGLGRSRTEAQISELAQIQTNWEDILYKTGESSSYNLAIASGSENSTTRFSVGYDTEEGIVVGYDGFQRISASLNNNTTINDIMNYGYSLNGSYSTIDDPRDRRNVQSPFWSEYNNNPYAPLYQLDTNGNQILDGNGNPIFNIAPTLNSFGYQVQDEIFNTDQERRNLRLFGSAFFEVFITKDLKARTQFGGNYDRLQSENFLRPSARLNSFIGTQGTKTDRSSDRLDYNWRNELSYGKQIGNHEFKVTVASEYTNENFYTLVLSSRNYPNDFQNTQNLAGSIDQTSNTSRFTVSRFGYIGAINYNYDKKYFINAYARRDGSSLAGFDNQYGTFYGGSASWDIAKESFMDSADWVNALKLSVSYGTLGDESGLARYSNFSAVTTGLLYGNNPAAVVNGNVANPDVTWETNEKFNVGISFELLEQSRLRGSIDYFKDTRKDFIFGDNFSVEAGGYSGFINAGDSEVSGLELNLSYDVFKNYDGFNMTVFGNVTKADYEITALVQDQFLSGFPGGQTITQVGSEPFTYNLVRYAGVDPANGDALYYDADGNITNTFSAQDAVAIEGKSPLPEFFGGFGLSANYKGFDFTTNFNFSVGNYVYNLTALNAYDFAGWQDNRIVGAANYWQQPGDTNVLPRPVVNGIEGSTDQFLQDASYLAWRNLTVGYTFGDNVFGNTSIESIRMYLQAQGLAIWSEFEGNPEIGDGSTEDANNVTIAGTYSAYTYPRVRSFNVGFDINF